VKTYKNLYPRIYSFGNLYVGRGTHRALDQCHAWARQYRYAFHGDVVKYFPSIPTAACTVAVCAASSAASAASARHTNAARLRWRR